MKFSLDQSDAMYRIKSYESGAVTVLYPPTVAAANVIAMEGNTERPRLIEEQLTTSFIIAPAQLVRGWPPHNFAEVTESHLDTVAELDAEIVLLGTGARAHLPNAAWMAKFARRGIGLETMATGAACRTYNVLMSEGRRVVAAILVE